MKTFILKLSALTSMAVLLLLAVTSSSCNKDKTCHGKVTVTDTNGTVLPSVAVHLSANSVGGQVTYDGITDGSGVVSFDVKLPAIFDVKATKSGLTGTGILRLDEPGKTGEATVKIK